MTGSCYCTVLHPVVCPDYHMKPQEQVPLFCYGVQAVPEAVQPSSTAATTSISNSTHKKPCTACGNADCRYMRMDYLRQPIAYGRCSQADPRLCPADHVAKQWSQVGGQVVRCACVLQ